MNLSGWQVRRRARRLARSGTPDAVRALAQAYAAGTDERVVEIAGRALTGLTEQAAVDAVCEMVIATSDERLSTVVTEAGYRHSDPVRRAVLLFLIGQFDAYAELDFDGSLLAAARLTADDGLRTRLAERARAAGRVEWVRAVVGGSGPGGVDGLSDREWEATVETLTGAGQWGELWRLATQAPPVLGVRILRELDRRRWRPDGDADRIGFAELVRLARACPADPLDGLLTDKPKHLDTMGHGEAHLAFVSDGKALLVGRRYVRRRHGHPIGVWWLPDGAPHRMSKNWDPHADKPPANVVALPDDRVVAVRSNYVGIYRLRREPFATLDTLAFEGPGFGSGLALAPDGRLLLAARGRDLVVWRPPWTEPIILRLAIRAGMTPGEAIVDREDRRMPSLAVSHIAGGCVAVGYLDGYVDLLRLPSAERTVRLRHRHRLHSLTVTPDGRLLASGGSDGAIRLWRLPSGEPAGVLAAEGATSYLAVTPDGRLLAGAGARGTVRLWRLPSGEPVGVLSGHEGSVRSLAVSPDGGILASGGEDMTVRLWHLPSGQPAGVLSGHVLWRGQLGHYRRMDAVTSLGFARDGNLLASACDTDPHVLLWRLWDARLRAVCRTPVSRIDPVEAARLPDAVSNSRERGWATMIAALVRWRYRHDIEVDSAPAPPGVGDIEVIDG